MSKKKTKKLRKALASQFTDWLDERSPEELEQLRVTFGITKPSFRAALDPKARDERGESAA